MLTNNGLARSVGALILALLPILRRPIFIRVVMAEFCVRQEPENICLCAAPCVLTCNVTGLDLTVSFAFPKAVPLRTFLSCDVLCGMCMAVCVVFIRRMLISASDPMSRQSLRHPPCYPITQVGVFGGDLIAEMWLSVVLYSRIPALLWAAAAVMRPTEARAGCQPAGCGR